MASRAWELMEETRLGRVIGPATPDEWPVRTHRGLGRAQGAMAGDVFAATSFAILQEDENGKVKIRRGEDWSRSSHNATPHTNHTMGDIAIMVRRLADGGEIHIFGRDVLNAYRQWPVRHPSHNATFLHTEYGLTLRFRMAMCFGAAASVWNLNRVADALQLLIRMLLLMVGGHYVDDFNGLEYADRANAAFNGIWVSCNSVFS